METSLKSSSETIKTVCAYCGVGCGISIEKSVGLTKTSGSNIDNKQRLMLSGDETHPANGGRLCVKGTHLLETTGLDERLLSPKVEGRDVSWEESIQAVADKFQDTISKYGPNSVAFYLSGQLLTEDYYVANKLMKGFIGSANIDTNSRLCMSSAVAGHQRAFGSDSVPGCYEDFELADLIVIVGSNMAWTHPVVFQKIMTAKEKDPNKKIVVIDPRATATSSIADIHLNIQPQHDAALFNLLLDYLEKNKGLDNDYLDNHCEGFGETLRSIRREIKQVKHYSSSIGVTESQMTQFFKLFLDTPKTVTVFSQGVNQSLAGVDTVNAIINCHLATGRVGKVGASPFSITGQPNAMGGREVGGLSNQLTAHLSLHSKRDRDSVQAFWGSNTIADKEGLKAVDLFEAIARKEVRAVWIMGTNPVFSLPNRNKVTQALSQCDFVVVSDCNKKNDTMPFANVLLPALTWGEKEGMVTNSERCLSKQNAFLLAPKNAKADWKIITMVAQAMGFTKAFNYHQVFDVFKEFVSLSKLNKKNAWEFNLSGLKTMSLEQYQYFKPRQWPILNTSLSGTQRLFSDGMFNTKNRKAKVIPIVAYKTVEPKNPIESNRHLDVGHKWNLNTGRVRDQWHSMTRTGYSERLMAHTIEPTLSINPSDGVRLNIVDNDFVRIESQFGRALLKVRLTDEINPHQCFLPMHWGDLFCRSASVNLLIGSERDSISGQPQFKQTNVSISKVEITQFILVKSKERLINTMSFDYISTVKTAFGYSSVIGMVKHNTDLIHSVVDLFDHKIQWKFFRASEHGSERALGFRDKQCCIMIHISNSLLTHQRSEFIEVLSGKCLDTQLGDLFLLNLSADRESDRSENELRFGKEATNNKIDKRVVCVCMNVCVDDIENAIESGCTKMSELSRKTKAGTNCGSCLPEVKMILSQSLKVINCT